jgi:hypothetical protein
MCCNEIHNGTRRAGILAVMACAALLVTACGGSSGSSTGSAGSSHAGGSATYKKELAFARCMRSHGVPNFPDPRSTGTIIIGNGGGSVANLNSSQMVAAQNACRDLLPNGGVASQAQRQQITGQLLKFARCMRSHGVPNFPDPSGSSIQVGGSSGINPKSPQFQSAQRACQSVLPKPAVTP